MLQRVLKRGVDAKPKNGQARETVADLLAKVDVFRDLGKTEIEVLFQGVMLRECAPGTVFFTPDQPSERLFILKTGQVDLYRITSHGKRLLVRRIGAGAIFGEMGILGQSMEGCFAEATENSLVCIATREEILRVLVQRPEVALRVLEAVGSRLRTLEERLEEVVFSPVKVRLASFLLGNVRPGTDEVQGFTQGEVADVIGALRQTVTEALSEMQRSGWIEVAHKRVRVLDSKALETLVSEGGSGLR
ncbi:MAG: Crp/Fnr family transcriptional regulator [Chloroflexi bacterium]|nr:Crp/Fnr family transcriptional regulator [Chloroflexota bacterium]